MVKEKPNSIRTYDAEGFKRRAACLCVKDDNEAEVLLVSSSGKPGRWVVPGGGIEPAEQAERAAAREANEEAGVRGDIGRRIGVFENDERKTRTEVFILIVTELLEDWEDAKQLGRQRKWFSIDEARLVLKTFKPLQMAYLNSLHVAAPSGNNTHQASNTQHS